MYRGCSAMQRWKNGDWLVCAAWTCSSGKNDFEAVECLRSPVLGTGYPNLSVLKTKAGDAALHFPFDRQVAGARTLRVQGGAAQGIWGQHVPGQGAALSCGRWSGRLSQTLHASTIFEAGHLTLLLFQAKSDQMLNKQAIPANPTTTRLCDRSSEVIHSVDHRIGEYLCTNRTSPTQRRRTRLGGSHVAKARNAIQDARVTDWQQVSKSTRSWTKPLASASAGAISSPPPASRDRQLPCSGDVQMGLNMVPSLGILGISWP